jgi:Asp/Glu/hydantoin racemase
MQLKHCLLHNLTASFLCTGLGVVDLWYENQAGMEKSSVQLALGGVELIVLGCAGNSPVANC